MLPKGSRFKQHEEDPKVPKLYIYLAAAAAVAILIFGIWWVWPAKKAYSSLNPSNFNLLRAGMTRAEVLTYMEVPPGDYRSKNRSAANPFDAPAPGMEHVIWHTDFGHYCVVVDTSTSKVVRIDRKPAS